jgi:Tc toxin complex TcA C-terminal TcB-binding domain
MPYATTYIPRGNFHGFSDDVATRERGSAGRPEKHSKHTTTQGRELSYGFYSHFHPYVAKLVNRLIEGSVRGLQATDTEYEVNSDGTWKALPHSTLAALAAETEVTFPGGDKSKLGMGTPVTLADGTLVKLPTGPQAALPGDLVLTDPRGLRLSAVGGGKEALTFGTKVELVSAAIVALPNGLSATLPANTELAVTSCKPQPKLYAGIFSTTRYNPSGLVRQPYPVRDLDFTSGGAYSAYNWELFFHVPITIAIHLSKNQRFEEAMRWFHLLFDPTDDSDGPTPERFWKVKPFQFTDAKLIEEILVNLSSGADPVLQQETVSAIQAWKDAPFRPHLVARYRHTAYMLKAVMAYLDNLIVWGDALFRQDTGESINEATQLYVLAANILGPRPQAVPKKGSVRPQTYANLKKDLDEFGNAAVKFETDIPFDVLAHPDPAGDLDQFTATLRSLGNALYFCVPRNDKLLSYWDTVADRLFKIRNSLNFQGIFRQLALFEPPIDPAMLARATAAGLDVGAIINGLNQPLPLVRFQVLVQKAAEICQEVKSLGNNLLSAMEKEDGEAMAILRARHERVVMEMVEQVRYAQVQEAIKSREGLLKSLALAVQRYTYYERQSGKKANEITIPALDQLDKDSLDKMTFKAGEPEMASREIAIDIAQDLGDSGGKLVSSHEAEELHRLGEAQWKQDAAAIADCLAAALSLIPEFGGKIQPFGAGVDVTFGGRELASWLTIGASAARAFAARDNYEAGKAAKIGGYARREQDWAFQSNLAAGEIAQIFKQLRAAEIREAITELELKNHRQQMRHAGEIERFLNEEGAEKNGKKSNKAIYLWMKREVKALYGQCFQFAFDLAKKAERALQHELGNPELGYLQFGYLAGKEGLLAGEKLYFDIKRMELAYHDLNQREYELIKHVSLLQVNPMALLQLRFTGSCTVFVPEEVFDMDGPGHYFRRIKNVAVSIPCVTGPYTSVNCTLTLLKSSIRKNSLVGEDGYARNGTEDGRFSDYFGSQQSIVTSSGQNDSGLFETNLRDERFLPFELAGAISEWRLELPAQVREFDYDSISDVILHLRYTAREGGGLLRNGAVANLVSGIEQAEAGGSIRLFSIRHEFPTEWAKFKSTEIKGAVKTASLSLIFRPQHYPFWSQDRLGTVKKTELIAKTKTPGPVTLTKNEDASGDENDALNRDPSRVDLLRAVLVKNMPAAPLGPWTLHFTSNAIDDLWVALTWGA